MVNEGKGSASSFCECGHSFSAHSRGHPWSCKEIACRCREYREVVVVDSPGPATVVVGLSGGPAVARTDESSDRCMVAGCEKKAVGRTGGAINVTYCADHDPSTGLKKEAIKYDAGKERYGLIPPWALEELARVFTKGATKYQPWNWAQGMDWSRIYDAAQRHLAEWAKGESVDKETGLRHLAQAAWGCFVLLEYERLQIGKDDRWKPKSAS